MLGQPCHLVTYGELGARVAVPTGDLRELGARAAVPTANLWGTGCWGNRANW